MSAWVFFDQSGQWQDTLDCTARITNALQAHGIGFGHIDPQLLLGVDSLAAWQASASAAPALKTLAEALPLHCLDRVRLAADFADWPATRAALMTEHAHAQTEARCFTEGAALFYFRVNDGYVALLCEAGDWVCIPAGMPHLFDGGDTPDFEVIRLFSADGGGAFAVTGHATPALPGMDEFVAQLAEEVGVDAGYASGCGLD